MDQLWTGELVILYFNGLYILSGNILNVYRYLMSKYLIFVAISKIFLTDGTLEKKMPIALKRAH